MLRAPTRWTSGEGLALVFLGACCWALTCTMGISTAVAVARSDDSATRSRAEAQRERDRLFGSGPTNGTIYGYDEYGVPITVSPSPSPTPSPSPSATPTPTPDVDVAGGVPNVKPKPSPRPTPKVTRKATPKPRPKPKPRPSTKPAEKPKRYANCTAMRVDYPLGVRRGHPAYEKKHDGDNDGWACEPRK